MRVDLHTHSTASDGTDDPADLPRLAKQAGLDGFALTDHDTTAGLAAAEGAANKLGVRFLPGIELSVVTDAVAGEAVDPDSDAPLGAVHLLGYRIRTGSAELLALEQRMQDARATRNPQILDRLRGLGVSITEDEVHAAVATNGGGEVSRTLGRPHIAQVLLQKGYVKSIHEAFARYLGQGAAAYVARDLPTAAQAIDAVHAAGGVAVLAHPVHLRLGADALEHAVARLTDLGLDGIETKHTDHEPGDVRRLTALAERFGLITTGGSDYHGSRKTITLGSVTAPPLALEEIEAAAEQYA